jgi:peptide/nickel transport system substrate-binding protein
MNSAQRFFASRRPRRRAAPSRWVLTAAILALSAACAVTASAAGAGSRAETLRVAFNADNPILTSLDPFQVYWIEHRVVLRNVVESLTDQDPATGKIIPWLAESWEAGADGASYTFTLRDGVTFSNGERFDAEAVKIAFDSDKAFLAASPGAFGAAYLEGYDHAEVIDSHRIKIVLSKPNAGFLQATSTTTLAILAPESYKRSARERSLGAIIGTGPYVLASYAPEVGIELVRRKGYGSPSRAVENGGDSYLERIDVRYVPEASVRNGQFILGETDILWPRDPFSEVDIRVFKGKGAKIASRSLPGPAYNLYPNVAAARQLADPGLRKALQKAIDRTSYARTVYSDDFPVVEGIFDATTPYFKSEKEKLGYDPDGAAKLLDAAGWTLGKDRYRYKSGKRLSLLCVLWNKETAGDLLLQDQLRKVGIELKLSFLVPGEMIAALSAGKYDLVGLYLTRGDPIALQSVLDPRFAPTSSRAVARNVYPPDVGPAAEKWFDVGLLATRDDDRARAYGELQDLLVDNNLAFPLYERVWQAALADKVQGFAWTAEGFAILNNVRRTP